MKRPSAENADGLLTLHERSKQTKNVLPGPQHRAPAGPVGFRDLLTLGEGAFKIRGNVGDGVTAIEHHVILKMVVQAPVVQIGGARLSHRHCLAWQKPGVYS